MTWEKRMIMRQEIRKKRRSLTAAQVKQNSCLIVDYLQGLKRLSQARTVMGYLAIDNEVDIWPYLENCLRRGGDVLLPRVEKSSGNMVAVRFTGTDNLRAGDFGILEPSGEAVPPADIEAVIVPGIAFDRRGYRLGYGKGYYDRFLSLVNPAAFIVAVAHNLQVVEDTMPHTRDFRIPCLITETGLLFE